ncbi:MAG: CNNM domain-containing protein [Chthoniobacterales bacterium]
MTWLVILACLVISFTFAGIESGVLSVNRVRLRHYALQGEEAALQLDALLVRIERLMITVVLVTNAANILGVTLAYSEFAARFGALGGAAAILALLPAFVLLLEFLPKAIFRRFPYRTLVIYARILKVTHWVLGPLVSLGARALKPAFLAQREPRRRGIVGIDDLKRVVADSAERGQMTALERTFVDNVIEFREAKVRDVMVRMEQSICLPTRTEVSAVLELARGTGEDRFPLVADDGGVQGILRVFDLLRDDVRGGRAQSYARRPITVAANERALSALSKLRAARMQLGIVTGRDGKPVGTVRTEALVRRLLVGGR